MPTTGNPVAEDAAALVAIPRLRRRIRRLKSFQEAYALVARRIGERHGLTFAIDQRQLAIAFMNWSERFAAAASGGVPDRRDFAFFAAGVALAELMRAKPAKAASTPGASRQGSRTMHDGIVAFWPEGYLDTLFCLEILAGVLKQEFGEDLATDATLDDLEIWRSLRDNVRDDPELAIAFLDRFTGNPPNWSYPSLLSARPGTRRAETLAHAVTKAPERIG